MFGRRQNLYRSTRVVCDHTCWMVEKKHSLRRNFCLVLFQFDDMRIWICSSFIVSIGAWDKEIYKWPCWAAKVCPSTFWKPLSNVVAIVGDNCTTNKLAAHKAGCGFWEHKPSFQSRCLGYIWNEQKKVNVVSQFMAKLQSPVRRARVLNSQSTPLR